VYVHIRYSYIYCDVIARSFRKENSCSMYIKAYCTNVYCDVVAGSFRKENLYSLCMCMASGTVIYIHCHVVAGSFRKENSCSVYIVMYSSCQFILSAVCMFIGCGVSVCQFGSVLY